MCCLHIIWMRHIKKTEVRLEANRAFDLNCKYINACVKCGLAGATDTLLQFGFTLLYSSLFM